MVGVVGLENCTLRILEIFAGPDSALGGQAEEGGWGGVEEDGADIARIFVGNLAIQTLGMECEWLALTAYIGW